MTRMRTAGEAASAKGSFVLLCQVFYPEMVSTGKLFTELTVMLRELGWDIHVACAQPSVLEEAVVPKAPKVTEYEGVRISRMATIGSHRGQLIARLVFGTSFACSVGAWALKRSSSYDGIVVSTNPPFLGIVAVLIQWLKGTPFVVVVHDVYPDTAIAARLLKPRSPLCWLWERASRMMLRAACGRIVIGRDMGRLISSKLFTKGPEPVCFIPNWANARVVHPVPKSQNAFRRTHNPSDWFMVQYSGNIARIHNVEVLLDAAELLQDKPILFQFVGEGFKKQKLQYTARLRALMKVQFLSFQPEERLAEVLSAADLAVVCLDKCFTGSSVPSKAYGIMAAGVPMLGLLEADSEIGLTIAETGCGVVLPSATGSKVAQTILELSQQPERLHHMGERGYLAFKERFTLEKAAEQYDRVLTECFLKSARPQNQPEPMVA